MRLRLWRNQRPEGEGRSAVMPTISIDDYAALWARTASGQVVTPERALRNAAVAACVRVLTTTAATLPVEAIRSDGDRRHPITPTPVVVTNPSAIVRRRVWVAQIMRGLLLHGNVYGQIAEYDRGGNPTIVETLPHGAVEWRRDPDDQVEAPHVAGERRYLWPRGDLVHWSASAFVLPGSAIAQSPVELARESIGTAMAAEEFGARFFGDAGHPNVVISSSAELTREQAQGIKDRIKAAWVGREPAVLGSGLTAEFPEMDPSSSQFLDLIRFEVEQTARFFGVPPAMVYTAVSGQSVTYANIIDADNQYLKHSAGIWLNDLEDVWSSFLPGDNTQVRFNVDAFLRMDALGRHRLYTHRLRARTMTVNEVRALEDEEPFDGPEWDEPGVPDGFDSGGSVAEHDQEA